MKDNKPGKDDDAEKSIWLQFLETTSVKGVSRIARSPSLCLRVMWLVGFLFGTSMATYYLSSLFALYFSHKTVFSVNELEGKAPFPDITVCNLNPASAISNGQYLFQTYINKVTNIIQQVEKDMNESHERDSIITIMEGLESSTGFLQNLPVDILEQEDNATMMMLMECMWRGENNKYIHTCNKSVHQVVADANRGRCLTFHTNKSMNVFRALLYLNDFVEVYIPDFDLGSPQSMGGGARLMLHEPNTLPSPQAGINMPPGYHNSIVISASKRKGLPEPFSDCLETEKMFFPDGIPGSENVLFSSVSCADLCIQKQVATTCGCLLPSTVSTLEMRAKYPFCGKIIEGDITKTIENYNCAMKSMDDVPVNCDCPRACLEYQYNYRTFQARWPHPSLQVGFYKKYIRNKPYASRFSDYEKITKEITENVSSAYEMMWRDKLMRRNFLFMEVR